MYEEYDLNRAEFIIIQKLVSQDCKSYFSGMTIAELMDGCNGLIGATQTVYRKLMKLVNKGYLKKGSKDNHADTFYATEKSITLCKQEEEQKS